MRTVISSAAILLLALAAPVVAEAQWVQSAGPSGMKTDALHITSEGLLAISASGLYSKGWQEQSWKRVLSRGSNTMSEPFFEYDSVLFSGSYTSTDNGQTWVPNNLPGPSCGFTRIGSTVYSAVTNSSDIYASTDKGSHWVKTSSTNPAILITSIAAVDSALFAGANGAVGKTTDAGQTWTLSLYTYCQVWTVVTSGDSIYAGCFGGGFKRSTDKGVTWEQNNNGLTNTDVNAILRFRSSVLVGTHGGGVFILSDSSTSWRPVNKGLSELWINSLVVWNDTLFAGTDAGVFVSIDNAATWTPLNSGLYSQVQSLCCADSTLYAGTWGPGLWKTTNQGLTWIKSDIGIPEGKFRPRSLAFGQGILFAGTWSSGLFRSTDEGMSWQGTSLIGSFGNWLGVYGISILDSNVFVATDKGFYRSVDYGRSFIIQTNGLPDQTIMTMYRQGSEIYIEGQEDWRLYRSSDLGATWVPTKTERGDYVVWQFAQLDSTLFMASLEGLYFSHDLGDTWTLIGYLNYQELSCIQVMGDNIAVGSYPWGQQCKIWVSSDGGTDWRDVTENLPQMQVWDINFSQGRVWLATDLGVWSRPASEVITGLMVHSYTELEYTLSQNYPNPFNPTTIIEFELPRASHVSLTVYDILGREVSVLVNDRRDAGVYKVLFDASNLASGVYFYKLQAGSFVQTKKLLLLR